MENNWYTNTRRGHSVHFSSPTSTQTGGLTSCSEILSFHSILVYWVLHQCPVAAIANYHKLGGSKQQKRTLSRLWRGEEGSQAVCRTTPPPEALGAMPLLASSSFCWLQAFVDLCPHHPDLCLHLHTVSSSEWVSFTPTSLRSKHVVAFRAHIKNPI